MFEGLDDVDWGNLRHAYGPANDVPKLLRQLLCENENDVEEAIGKLFGNIFHQGTIYEATPYAVPYLVKAVKTLTTHHRDKIVMLLECIASGEGSNRIRTHEVMEGHLDELVGLLNDDNNAVRRHVPALLSVTEKGAAWLLRDGISAAKMEDDSYTTANILFAISRVCEGAIEVAREAHKQISNGHPIILVAKAHIALSSGDSSLSYSVATDVLEPILNPADFEDYHRGCSFNGWSGAEEFVIALLERLRGEQEKLLIREVCRILPSLKDDISASMLADSCLTKVFVFGRLPSSVDELTNEQRVILTQLDRKKNVMHIPEGRQLLMELQENGVLSALKIAPRRHW